MSIFYLDCSPFMHDIMQEQDLSALPIKTFVGDPGRDQIPELIQGCPVILNGHTEMDAGLLDRCPDLRTIVFLGTGASSYIDIAAAAERDISVRTIKGYGDQSIAEHTFALLLSSARRIVQMDTELRQGTWGPQEGLELVGTTLGIIGCGGIGQAVARIAQALGMHVKIWNRSPLPEPFAALQADFSTVLAESDFVSLHLGLNEETRHRIGPDELAAMKRGSILINTARGGLVDTNALIEALQRKDTLQYAALDVFETEPLPKDDRLLSLDNVTLTSHAAFKTRAASQRLLKMAIDIAAQELERSQPANS